LGNREEAEDATQSTFLNAFRGFKRGVDPEFESAWVYKIAQNVCLTRQRSSSRRRKVETPGDLEAMQDYVPAHQADSDELIRLPEALDAMPEQQRRALVLREWQGLSYKEIGDELDLSQAAVETLLFRARRSLAAGLSEEPTPVKKAAGIAKRLGGAGDLGTILSIVKSLVFTGGVKVATAVATVAATSVVAATPGTRHAVEDVVAPRHDEVQVQVHKVSTKPAASTRVAARTASTFSLVGRSAAAPAKQTARPAMVAAKARKHRQALRVGNATAGAALMVGHASGSAGPTAEISTPASTPTPTAETSAPAATAQPPAPVEATAQPQRAATQPADKPKSDSRGKGKSDEHGKSKTDAHGKSDAGDKNQSDATTTPKDNSGSGQGTSGGGSIPAAQPAAAATPAATPATGGDRSLSSSDKKSGDDKKGNDNKHGQKDGKGALQVTPPTVTAPTTNTTTTTTTPTTNTTTTNTTTTTTTAPPAATTPVPTPPAPVTTVVTVQQPRSDKSSRPPDGRKPDGKGDNNGTGRKK
jgi:RNA polymerase sigma factor (sigma-70 family)